MLKETSTSIDFMDMKINYKKTFFFEQIFIKFFLHMKIMILKNKAVNWIKYSNKQDTQKEKVINKVNTNNDFFTLQLNEY